MSQTSPGDEVPESDWAEQNVDADPIVESEGEAGERPVRLARGTREVDDADLVEQETIAYTEDEELR
jgi:hypothetical protein